MTTFRPPPLDADPRDEFVETPEGRCLVRIVGSGPAVLCLHGVSARGRSWHAVAERLRHRATFVMPDLVGRGASDPLPEGSFTLARETDRVEALIDGVAALEHSPIRSMPPVLAGHSQGAAIAVVLAARHRSVRGLLLSNPVTPWTRRPLALGALRSGLMRKVVSGIFSPLRRPLAKVIIGRAGGPRFRAPEDLVRGYAEPYALAARAETLMSLLRDWRPRELTGIRPPGDVTVRIVTGALDPRIRVSAARRYAGELGASLRVAEDGGHILPEQHPGLVADEMERLLDELGRAGPAGRDD